MACPLNRGRSPLRASNPSVPLTTVLHCAALCWRCVQALAAAGVLLKEEKYAHKYPYDWRTKKPTIFRATDQVRAGQTERCTASLLLSTGCCSFVFLDFCSFIFLDVWRAPCICSAWQGAATSGRVAHACRLKPAAIICPACPAVVCVCGGLPGVSPGGHQGSGVDPCLGRESHHSDDRGAL